MAQPLSVEMLGPLSVRNDHGLVAVQGRLPRALLIILALSVGRIVPVETLIDHIWAEDLPKDPRESLHTCVRRLRTQLSRDLIIRDAGGYRLEIDPESIDVHRFHRLLDDAEAAGDCSAERVLLGEALSLWRGTPFEETPSAWLARHEAPQLIERYLGARERRIDLDLAARQYAGLVAELRGLVAQHPLRESLRVRWMLALDAAGRRAEALSGYEDYRVLLADELGIDPGVELRDLHLRLLGDPEPPVAGPAAEPATQVEIPHQLPADLPGFAGRRDLLDRLDGLLERGPGVIAIHGPGGVGKSTLAVHWASRIAGCFPDGELFLNLRGYGPGEPMPPDEAAATLLAGLGVRGGQLPVGLEACTALLRTKLSSRRMLIVLDNARDAQQVRPLLPGSGSLVVITSRNQLRGLAAREGAVRLPVECWSRHEAAWFLRDRLRQQGEHAEGPSELPDLAELSELAELCGRLPLALAVIAEWSAWGARTTVADLRTALRDEAGRLDALATADDPLTDVRLALSWSYLALEPDTARLFRFLGLHPGGGISTAAAAALAGLPIDETRRRLDHLVAASLIRAVRRDRYDLHDLLQTYAAERADETEGRDETMPAIRRLTSYYIHSAGIGAGRHDGTATDPPDGAEHPRTRRHARDLQGFHGGPALVRCGVGDDRPGSPAGGPTWPARHDV